MRLIDADDLVRRVREFQQMDLNHKAAPYCWAYAYECFEDDIDEQPTIETEPVRRGKWVKNEEESANHSEPIYRCSACLNWEAWGNYECTPFCPHCGAKMEVEDED